MVSHRAVAQAGAGPRGRDRLFGSSATAIVLVAAVVAVIVYSAASGKHLRLPKAAPVGAPVTALARVQVPGGLYQALTDVGGRLVLAGGPGPDGLCHSAIVSIGNLEISARRSGACDNPHLFYRSALPVETVLPGAIDASTFSVSHAGPRGSWADGPVLARWTDLIGTAPVTAYGPGYLWAYLPLSSHGGQLLAVSLSSGTVVLSKPVPEAASPLLAAGSAELWFAASRALGPSFEPGLYRVRLGLPKVALLVKAAGARWLTGDGATVFFAAAAHLYALNATGQVRRASLQAPSPARGIFFAGAATGYVPGPGGDLWAVTGGGCMLAVTELDPLSGAYRTVTAVPPTKGCSYQAGSGGVSLASLGPDLFFFIYGGRGHLSYLYRLRA
jgi:outer membrane protein assembly factor BamB